MALDHLQNQCNLILQNVRSCGLNYNCQETPFSIYITLRKSLVTYKSTLAPPEVKPDPELYSQSPDKCDFNHKYEKLAESYNSLQKAYDTLKDDFEDAVNECEHKNKIIFEQNQRMQSFESKITNLESDTKTVEANKEAFKKENKKLKLEILEKENDAKETRKQIKIVKKEKQDLANKYKRQIVKLDSKVENLLKYKAAKAVEEKTDKEGLKKLSKRIKMAEDEKAKIVIENTKLFRQLNKSTESQMSQTDQHPDLPLKITDPLPPIFSSQLCHKTPSILFLSRSLPNLDKICWSKPDDAYLDEAEEYLNNQYDQEVKQFYLDARLEALNKKKDKLKDTIT